MDVGDWKRNGHIDLSKHQTMYIAGDVHGDMFALLKVLELTGCVEIAPHYFAQSAKCWSNYKRTYERTKSTISSLAQLRNIRTNVAWVGGTSVVAFLGDILDNKRGSNAAENGNCAWEGTQYQMLDILLALREKALADGGNVIWVLGNHDIWNISPIVQTCHRYSPAKQQKCTDEKCNKPISICTNEGGYTKKHRGIVKDYMRKMGAVALIRVSGNTSMGKTHVLAMHGGITDITFFQNQKFRPYASRNWTKLNIQPGKAEKNIDKINAVYAALYTPHDDKQLFKFVEAPSAPTWCRPTQIENGKDLKRFFSTSKICKAHDVQQTGANCNVKGRDTGGAEDNLFKESELCRMDVAMSRAFERENRGDKEKQFSLIHLWVTPEGMRRQIRTVYETMDRNMEYKKYIDDENNL